MNNSKFKTQPYKHQLECLNKFGRAKAFALLAEMGTGKTFIMINNLADLWSSRDCDAALIFAPNGVHANWTRLEIPKHMPDWVKYKSLAWQPNHTIEFKKQLDDIYSASNGELRIFTMNWEALQSKRGIEEANRFCKTAGKLAIICDESDSIKNPKAIRTKELMKLKKYSMWRRIMSGTPVNNAPFDLFSQFLFLDESILQTTSYYAFKTEYAEMLDSNNRVIQKIAKGKVHWKPEEIRKLHINANNILMFMKKSKNEILINKAQKTCEFIENSDYEHVIKCNDSLRSEFDPNIQNEFKTYVLKLMHEMDTIIANHSAEVQRVSSSKRMPQIVDKDKSGKPKYKNLNKLSKLIAPHSFRVLKNECIDLPKKIYKNAFFDLTKEQRSIYKKAEDECRIVFEGNEVPFSKLTAVTKLSQITSGYYIHPLSDSPVRIEGNNPKLSLLANRVEAIVNSDKKVLIWARYTTEIRDIENALKEIGIDCVTYYGETSAKKREDAIDAIQNGSCQVFVGNQRAGGTGITLTAASYVIYYSNDFSLRNRLQSEDRAHRIGQDDDVTYINLIGKDTIDEAVARCLLNKEDVADEIVNKGLKFFSHNGK